MGNPIIIESLRSVIGPSLLAVIFLLAVWRPFKKDAPAPPGWALALSLGGALIAGRLIALGFPGFWPTDTTRRFWIVMAAATVIGVLASLPKASSSLARHKDKWGAPVLWIALSALSAWALSAHKIRLGTWEGAEAFGWIALWTAALAIGPLSFRAFARSADARWSALVVSAYAGLASAIAVISWAALTSQSMGVVSAWAGMLFGVALLRPSFRLGPAAPIGGLVVQSVLMIAYLNAPQEPPRVALGLALAAPLILASGPLAGWLRSLPVQARAVLQALAVALALGLAAYSGYLATSSGDEGGADDPYADLYQ